MTEKERGPRPFLFHPPKASLAACFSIPFPAPRQESVPEKTIGLWTLKIFPASSFNSLSLSGRGQG